ncbi:PREDICTED: uncharacterized protein LOC109472248 [Branchiostoma belcheri]|uniref:Uncharacterized protein LOC109472248 n=1 Tax=Branchiostoma belcheri TaxID=7741 RepID=A0A6P4Z8N0_BRABE|nr:PREDICTED: uncharacterized protein LOC109472248 [Branchiostoma belcheri]
MADDKWHWMKNAPPKKDSKKGFFSSLADAVRGRGPSPDKASLLASKFSKAYALGVWTLCVAAGVHWYYHRDDKPISDESVSTSFAMTPDHTWEKKTVVGTFTFEGYKPSDINPNRVRIFKRKVKDWWNTNMNSDASVDEKHAEHNKGTT